MDNKVKIGIGVALLLLLSVTSKARGFEVTESNGFTPNLGTANEYNESFSNVPLTANSRAVKNNNPCNIIYDSSVDWAGAVSYVDNTDTDPSTGVVVKKYEQFISFGDGVFAACYIVRKLFLQDITTVEGVLIAWKQNVTPDYINFVAAKVGKNKNEDFKSDLLFHEYDIVRGFVQGVARWESGRTNPTQPEIVTNNQFSWGYDLYLY